MNNIFIPVRIEIKYLGITQDKKINTGTSFNRKMKISKQQTLYNKF